MELHAYIEKTFFPIGDGHHFCEYFGLLAVGSKSAALVSLDLTF